NKEIHESALGQIAREAKARSDARLRTERCSKHQYWDGSLGSMKTKKNVQREVFRCWKSTRKFSFGWSSLGWKAFEQAERAVCLEEMKRGDVLLHLPCAHRFHWDCVVPWLESSSRGPCCRMMAFP
ncbi:zinc finger family protein, partial [Musa troglodytarum]